MLDSGASHHLVCGARIRSLKHSIRKSANPFPIRTANGVVPVTDEIELYVPSLDTVLCFYVLKNTPDLLSLGKLCRDHGVSVKWKGNDSGPLVIDEFGKPLDTYVSNQVPFIDSEPHFDFPLLVGGGSSSASGSRPPPKPSETPRVSSEVGGGLSPIAEEEAEKKALPEEGPGDERSDIAGEISDGDAEELDWIEDSKGT